MLSWLKYCVAIIGRAFLTMAALVVAVAFGIAVQHQFGGSFWVHARFPAFCRFPLRLALVLHRSKALYRSQYFQASARAARPGKPAKRPIPRNTAHQADLVTGLLTPLVGSAANKRRWTSRW